MKKAKAFAFPKETSATITRLLVIQGDKKCRDIVKRHDTLELRAASLICTLACVLQAVDMWRCGARGATYPAKYIAAALDQADKEYPVTKANRK